MNDITLDSSCFSGRSISMPSSPVPNVIPLPAALPFSFRFPPSNNEYDEFGTFGEDSAAIRKSKAKRERQFSLSLYLSLSLSLSLSVFPDAQSSGAAKGEGKKEGTRLNKRRNLLITAI